MSHSDRVFCSESLTVLSPYFNLKLLFVSDRNCVGSVFVCTYSRVSHSKIGQIWLVFDPGLVGGALFSSVVVLASAAGGDAADDWEDDVEHGNHGEVDEDDVPGDA